MERKIILVIAVWLSVAVCREVDYVRIQPTRDILGIWLPAGKQMPYIYVVPARKASKYCMFVFQLTVGHWDPGDSCNTLRCSGDKCEFRFMTSYPTTDNLNLSFKFISPDQIQLTAAKDIPGQEGWQNPRTILAVGTILNRQRNLKENPIGPDMDFTTPE